MCPVGLTSRRRIWMAVGLLTVAFGVAAASFAQTGTREEALERIRGEIAELQARLSRAQQQERTIETQLRETQLELTIQERRVDEANAALEIARLRTAAQERRVAQIEEELLRVREDLRRRLAALYRLGRAGYLRLLLAAETEREALPAIRQVRYLARRDAEALDRFVDTKVRSEMEQEQLLEERARVETWAGQEETRRARLEELRQEQSRLLVRVEQQRRSLESRTEVLEDKERKLSNFIAFLYGRADQTLTGRPLQEFKGVLDWPYRGRVMIPFGPRRDERYGTKVPHNGVEMATQPGAEVRAVYPGKVLFAAHFKGYGPTAIVHHPGRVFTLYAGVEALRVSYGDVVSLGEIVGRADDSFYFEIRIENRPEDPLIWLRD